MEVKSEEKLSTCTALCSLICFTFLLHLKASARHLLLKRYSNVKSGSKKGKRPEPVISNETDQSNLGRCDCGICRSRDVR